MADSQYRAASRDRTGNVALRNQIRGNRYHVPQAKDPGMMMAANVRISFSQQYSTENLDQRWRLRCEEATFVVRYDERKQTNQTMQKNQRSENKIVRHRNFNPHQVFIHTELSHPSASSGSSVSSVSSYFGISMTISRPTYWSGRL